MLLRFFLLILGLAIIVKSADILIDSAAKLARRFGVSTFVIGITVIAFGTSAPELAVGIVSGVTHTNQLTLGNIVGSSMANSALIVGLSAVIFPLYVKDTVVKREIPMLIAVQLALAAMLLTDGSLSRIDGFLLIGGFLLFMLYVILDARKSMKITIDPEGDIDTDNDGNRVPPEPPSGVKKHEALKLWLLSVASLVGLFIGGKLTVDSSTGIAEYFGLSQMLIGLTVVSLATTMPELITSIVAARKKEPEIVLGNCIGSSIFNILLVLGSSAAISPITVSDRLLFDFAAILTVTVFIFIISLLRKKLRRITGVILLGSYIAYITVKIATAVS